eukprot:CAMPEP_0114996358 /NCGR_PEP_ID=MMETSP0216-20121206/14258_1 /TAXON_ID=223996 /ORGANISM="Protocruzia adherens, Strain Boccale" /LENGTH=96 /DNA_ID=CAMNT_0002360537 /DNA_START=2023 /DNA_END=2314 /DNA_ORIENTATION=-
MREGTLFTFGTLTVELPIFADFSLVLGTILLMLSGSGILADFFEAGVMAVPELVLQSDEAELHDNLLPPLRPSRPPQEATEAATEVISLIMANSLI